MTLTATIQTDKHGYIYNVSGVGGGVVSSRDQLAEILMDIIRRLPDFDKK